MELLFRSYIVLFINFLFVEKKNIEIEIDFEDIKNASDINE